MASDKKQAPTANQDELTDIIRRTEAVSSPYVDMMKYLGMRDAVPPMEMDYIRSYGVYKKPTAELPKGKIVLNPGVGAVTLTHEVTHPVVEQLHNQMTASRAAGTDKQFTDAFTKILYDTRPNATGGNDIPILEFVKKLAPEWAAKSRYRASIGELPAFALERAAIPESRSTGMEAPPHVDPTIATQMMILLDLATRAQKSSDSKTKQGR